MGWFDLLENPKAVQSIFSIEPSLNSVELTCIDLERDGPTLVLGIQLNDYPNTPPERWQKIGASTVILKVEVLELQSLNIEGWAVQNTVAIDSIEERRIQ